jgi:glutamine---fructose-6-phosphate transaminase (isomerizing)
MCGIFGIVIKPNTSYSPKNIEVIIRKIALISESRGKDSSGFVFKIDTDHLLHVIKGDIPIGKLLDGKIFAQILNKGLESYAEKNGFVTMGHARLVTNGSQLQEVNNQPVIKDGIITIHNGIIVNVNEIWEKHTELSRNYLIDTEIIPCLTRQAINKNNDLLQSCKSVYTQLLGTYSTASLFQELDQIVLATNNGSLYYITDNESFFLFASERYFLTKLQTYMGYKAFMGKHQIKQLVPNCGIVVNLKSIKINIFKINSFEEDLLSTDKSPIVYHIKKHLLNNTDNKKDVIIESEMIVNNHEKYLSELLEYNNDAITKLKRCTKCILPETFPYIEFNEKGVCNYCEKYNTKSYVKSLLELKKLVDPYRSRDGKPDCIVPFSGGRDSTYTLHFVKRELGLNPIAFTYDWGMVTDLARRNIARVCGKLGVENIIVAADINWKRQNIKKNINAWLRRPNLGMIPLFMAGDKYFFYYANKIKHQNGIKLNIWGINQLENTDFKVGFCGIKPDFGKKTIYSLKNSSKLELFSFVSKNIMLNPAYLNESIFNSLGSFLSRYVSPKRDYYHFFDFYPWNEKEIEELIIKEYDWEKASDTNATWRIGDGTAGFYNYIYYTVAGFTEHDTFRSNQIREGLISREDALRKVNEENLPRFESIMWYTKMIGLDFSYVIKQINKIDKLYKK